MSTNLGLEKINKENGQILTSNDLKKHDDNFDKIQDAFNNISNNINLQQSKTYAELQTMVANNQLVAGSQYLLIDYKTKYQQPDTLVIKEVSTIERLILTANSTNSFEIICSSLDYPQDIIYYRFDMNLCEDNITSRNGFIIRRVDIINGLNCTGDWRNMLWARYLPNSTQYLIGSTLTNYSVWTSGNAQLNVIYKSGNGLYIAKNTNVPSDSTDSSVFYNIYTDITVGKLRNDLIVGHVSGNDIKIEKSTSYLEYLTFGNGCKNIELGENIILHNNIFDNNCYNNVFKFGCYNNTFGNSCHSNVFESGCYNNYFGIDCSYNSFGNDCYNNTFGNSCNYNCFKSGCNGNTFGISCHGNTFKSNCFGNTFGIGCYGNTFGNSCYNNVFESSCYNNTCESSCFNNTFGKNKQCLFIKYLRSKDMSLITTLESRNYTTTIEARSDNTIVYWSLNSSNVPQYSSIP